MACNSKENTLRWFMKRDIISETREVLDLNKFNMANTIFTERAINEYGLNTLGNLLFTTSESEGAVGIAKDRAIRKKIRRAEPNSVLFDNLDKLIEAREEQDANQRPDAINESPKEVKAGVSELFETNTELANAVYEAMGLTTINESDITYTDEEGNPCAKMGLTNTTKGTGWKIVKDFKGQPKHSQGGVDISISDKGVSMRRGGKDIKAAHGLIIPNNN